jgi:hypothetical protein
MNPYRSAFASKDFWLEAVDRAVRTAAQAALLVLGAGQATADNAAVNAWLTDWSTVAGFGAGGAVVSVLSSLVTAGIGPKDTPQVL